MGWENARRPLLTDPKDTVKFSWITKLIRLNGELPFQCSNTFNTQTTSRIIASDQAFPTCQAGARRLLCAGFFILMVSPQGGYH